ncbi:protein-disulfide reductase DsbD domain-containing protein [Terrarubrum flagellatum]|uniref:protein-disulfide reductase DsbD domain-containing protein n=1 Tax=Terrirubrum flagellatum TaxID=2895980 RepID=UPI00314511A8
MVRQPAGAYSEIMLSRRTFGLAMTAGAMAPALPRMSLAGPENFASPWSRGSHSAVRLLAAGKDPASGDFVAGLEFELAKGFKTYWRDPGDAGVPPNFDWSGSENIASAEVLWPAPIRFEDGAGFSIGYYGPLILPVKAKPRDARAPARLELKIDYAICETMCIPAQGAVSLALMDGPPGPHAGAIADAIAKVPASVAIGAASPSGLSIVSIKVIEGKKAALAAEVIAPDAAQALDLFIEGPKGSFFGKPVIETIAAKPGDMGSRRRLIAPIEERARDLAQWPLCLTLVADAKAIETDVTIDAPAKK